MALRIVIVRHGESTYNIEKRIQGRSDASELTDKGIGQAQAVRGALLGLGFERAWVSPLRRAKQTAEHILADTSVPLHPTPLLREIDLTAWEGLTFDEVKTRFGESYRSWRDHPHNLQLNGGFPLRDLWQQAQDFWGMLHQDLGPDPSGTLLVVGHSGINRALIATALQLGGEHYHHLGQDNCAISVLNFPSGVNQPAQLESLNLTTHLEQPLPKAKGGLRLLLVRHGETQWNREQRFQGQIDVPLNEKGHWQALQVADFLKEQTLDLAFSSPLKRPWETAEAICQHHPHLSLNPIPELQEICHGDWEGKLQADIEAQYPGMLQVWQSDPHQVQMPSGENLEQVWERAALGWGKALEATARHSVNQSLSETTSLVVAHDAVNKAIVCQLFGLSPRAFWAFKQGNGSVTVIDYPEGIHKAPVLRTLNITSHLCPGILDRTAAGAL